MLSWFKRHTDDASNADENAALPRVNLTPTAREQLAKVLAAQSPDTALRVMVKNPGDAVPEYDMALDTPAAADVLLDAEGLRVISSPEALGAVDGATIDFVAVRDDVVYLALGGGCQGCSMASVTLKQGIEQIIKQMIPRVREVVDVTDHAQGSNPFYTAEKGGESPFHQHAKA